MTAPNGDASADGVPSEAEIERLRCKMVEASHTHEALGKFSARELVDDGYKVVGGAMAAWLESARSYVAAMHVTMHAKMHRKMRVPEPSAVAEPVPPADGNRDAWAHGADGKWRWRGMAGFSAVVRPGPPRELHLGPQWAVVTPYGTTGPWTFAPTVAEACAAAEQDVTAELNRAALRASNGIVDPPATQSPSKSDALAKIAWRISEIEFELRQLRVPGEPGDHDDLAGCLSLISRWLLERSREESE